MPVKINSLEFENVKRIKAVKIEPTENGLTIIGGRNNQGKTSVLDAICWAVGGESYRPSSAQREGSVIPPSLCVTLSNGITVERKGKNSALKVTDTQGKRGGQQLLNSFIETFALDLPRFMNRNSKEKAKTLLRIIGVEETLLRLESQEQELYNKRRAIGQIADQKSKYAREMIFYPDVPGEIITASELIRQQQDILARNGENQRKRAERERYDRELDSARIAFEEAKKRLEAAEKNAFTARKSAENLIDESTAELEKNISDIEIINAKIRANLEKEKAEEEAEKYKFQYNQLTSEIENVRNQKNRLLADSDLPLPELSVSDGELTYKGQKWDNMSGSEQLKVSAAIVRRLNPECGFVLMDKLEQMDMQTLKEFGEWLESEGLQAIATRVSSGDECSVIIEDGYVSDQKSPQTENKPLKKDWKSIEW